MIRLDPNDYASAAVLLAGAPFNVLMAKAVVVGRVQGEVFADSVHPTSVYVRHRYGMSFLVGYSTNQEFGSELVANLADKTARHSPEWLQVYPLDWAELLDPLTA
ncbi:MAG: hypothetical protein WBV06_09975, partial [Acidimicrobiia bacterium]